MKISHSSCVPSLKYAIGDVVGSGGGVCQISTAFDFFGILTCFIFWPLKFDRWLDELDAAAVGALFLLLFTVVWRHSLLRCKRVSILCSKRVGVRAELMKKSKLKLKLS